MSSILAWKPTVVHAGYFDWSICNSLHNIPERGVFSADVYRQLCLPGVHGDMEISDGNRGNLRAVCSILCGGKFERNGFTGILSNSQLPAGGSVICAVLAY